MKQLQEKYSDAAPKVEEIVSDEFKEIPIIDLKKYIESAMQDPDQLTPEATIECQKVAECFHKFGLLLIRDPRVDMKDNEDYIDMMEDYFEKTGDLFYKGQEIAEIRPDCLYQVGVMPEMTEIARNHSQLRAELNLSPEDQPLSPLEPVLDAKWRFMWKIGMRPAGAADDFP